MKTARLLSIAIAFAFSASALAACSGGEPSDDDDVGGGDDTEDPPDQTGVSPVGKYALASEFDLASGLPGTVGDVVNELIAATDGSDDPGRYLCDKAADALGGTIGDIAHGVCGIAGGYINDQILAVAPEFVDTLLQM